MFSSLNLSHSLPKADFKREEPGLRARLIDMQFELLERAEFPVLVLLSGTDLPGRSAVTKQLMSWMDPRHIRTYASFEPTEEEQRHPRMWRFWEALPEKGRIGLFMNTWYETPIGEYLMKRSKRSTMQRQIDEIIRLEDMLAAEGALILKFMLLLSDKDSTALLKNLQARRVAGWKPTDREVRVAGEYASNYGKMRKIIDQVVDATSTGTAPWIPIASKDARYRDFTVGSMIEAAVQKRLNAPTPKKKAPPPSQPIALPSGPNILSSLNLDQSLEKDDYRKQLAAEQKTLSKRLHSKKFEHKGLVVVFEGNDAAGKGGSIRRFVQAVDPRMGEIVPIAAPTDEERAQPYLWRFWRHVPKLGQVTIFDRSWYGRVLVERVEKFAPEADWRRAYSEIRAFERELTTHGLIVVKFWLAIDKEEQFRRFKEREKIGYKRYKITDEDWRNREKWDDYAAAVHEMVDRTGTADAPWTLVEANDKYFARVKVLKTINDRLQAEL